MSLGKIGQPNRRPTRKQRLNKQPRMGRQNDKGRRSKKIEGRRKRQRIEDHTKNVDLIRWPIETVVALPPWSTVDQLSKMTRERTDAEIHKMWASPPGAAAAISLSILWIWKRERKRMRKGKRNGENGGKREGGGEIDGQRRRIAREEEGGASPRR